MSSASNGLRAHSVPRVPEGTESRSFTVKLAGGEVAFGASGGRREGDLEGDGIKSKRRRETWVAPSAGTFEPIDLSYIMYTDTPSQPSAVVRFGQKKFETVITDSFW